MKISKGNFIKDLIRISKRFSYALSQAVFLILTLTTNKSYGGFHSFTMHSRANCVTNESVSWWAGHNLYLRIRADHAYLGRYRHTLDTGWYLTWRQIAIHWTEGVGGWSIKAYHWLRRGRRVSYRITTAHDCNIYDGWWDRSS